MAPEAGDWTKLLQFADHPCVAAFKLRVVNKLEFALLALCLINRPCSARVEALVHTKKNTCRRVRFRNNSRAPASVTISQLSALLQPKHYRHVRLTDKSWLKVLFIDLL
jgi:hypothetical protein